MNKKFLFSTILFCFYAIINGHAQVTKVYGKASNANSYTIELRRQSDFLSMMEQKVCEDLIQDDGSFSMKIELKTVQLFFISIGFQNAPIYLEPGKSYELEVNYDPEKEQITFVNKPYLAFEVLDADENELNHKINAFEFKVNQFLVDNFNQIYKYRNKKTISQFSDQINAEFKNSSPFLKTHIDYRLASIEENSGLKNRNEIAQSYFKNTEVFFENDEAMRFFNQVFDQYLLRPNTYFELPSLMNEINGKANLELIFTFLNQDPLLEKQSMKELALLKGLQELYYKPSTNKKALLALIHNIGSNSLNIGIIKIATNLVQHLKYLRMGEQFPVAYKSEIKDFAANGKDLFLHFFTIPCIDCVREMDSISSLYQSYHKEVRFVSIALNAEPNEIDKLVKAKQYAWEIIVASEPFTLAEIYKIYSLPSYFLINSNNEIIMNPALNPWRGFSSSFKANYKH